MKLFDLFARCHYDKDGTTPIFDLYIQSPNFTGKKKEVMPVLPSILFMGRTKPPKYAFCHFFVLTTSKGDRNYGCCILFGEKKKVPSNNKLENESASNETSNNDIKKIKNQQKYKKSRTESDFETGINKSLKEKEQYSESDGESEDDDFTYLYAIAITSLLPLYQTLKNVLTCLLDVYPYDIEVAPFIINQIPMPPPGVVAVQFTFCDTTFLIPRPPPNQLPLIDLPFWLPFSLFGPKDLILIFTAVLTEQRIVFSSRFPAAIAPFIESILTLIYPLTCYSTYIPNLAQSMAPLLFSPLPYLIGVDPSVIPLDDLEDDILRVDLDTSSLYVSPNSIPPEIPTKPRQKLIKSLRKMTKLFKEKKKEESSDSEYYSDSDEDSDDNDDSDDDDDNEKKSKKRKRSSKINKNLVSINDDIDDSDETIKDDELIERKRKWILQCSSLVQQPVETIDLTDFNFTIPTSAITLPLMNGLFPEMIHSNKKDLFATFVKVRDAFLRFIIVLLMNTKQVSGKEVDNKINQFDSDFYKLFIGTQCFDVFIHQLNDFKQGGCKVKTLDEAKLLFFLESIQAKKNRSKLNKSKPTPFLTSSHWKHSSMFIVPFIPSKKSDFDDDIKPCNVADLVKNTQTLTFSRDFTVPLNIVKSVIISSPLSFQVPFPNEKEKKLKKIEKLGSIKKVVLIEKTIRGFMRRKAYEKMKKSAIIVHSFARMALCKTFYNQKMKPAAVKIHSTARMFLAKTKYKKMKKAAVMFQSAFRMYKQKKEYQAMRKAAIKIQSTFRMHRQRKEFLRMKEAAIKIQSTFRMHRQRKEFLRMKEAAIKIQSTFRMHRQRKEFLRMKEAAIKIQSTFRMHRQRKEFLRMKEAAIKIQSTFRMYLMKCRFKKMKESAIKIQSLFRGVMARKVFKKLKEKEIQRERERKEKEKKKKKEKEERERIKTEEKERKERERKEREERERKEREERERKEREERERKEREERERKEREERERHEREENEREEQLERERSSNVNENSEDENIIDDQNSGEMSKERQAEIQNLLSENNPYSLVQQAEYCLQLCNIQFIELTEKEKEKRKKKYDKRKPISKDSKLLKRDEKKVYKSVSNVQKKKTTKKRFNGIFDHFQIPVDSKKRKDKLNKKIFDILLLNPKNHPFEDTILASKLVLIGKDEMSIKEIKSYLS